VPAVNQDPKLAEWREGALSSCVRPVKVLALEESSVFGGAVLSLVDNIRRLQQTGRFHFLLLHRLDDASLAASVPASTILLRKASRAFGVTFPAGQRRSNTSYLADIWTYCRIIRQHQIDLVYANNSVENTGPLIVAASLTGRPIVIHERDVPSSISWSTRLLLRFVGSILAISSSTREALIRAGVPQTKISLVVDTMAEMADAGSDRAAGEGVEKQLAISASAADPAANMVIDEFDRVMRTKTGGRSLAWAKPFSDRRYADLTLLDRPRVMMIVDVEEEFDWKKPFPNKMPRFSSLDGLAWLVNEMNKRGILPCLMVDQCAVASAEAQSQFGSWAKAGKIELGAQLHSWVTPPFEEAISNLHSFQSNLPRDLERRKLTYLTEFIEQTTGVRPRVFRAGRYGLGTNTPQILSDLGYKVDTSISPLTNYYRAEGGPNSSQFDDRPFWLGEMLALPLMRSVLGLLARAYMRFPVDFFDNPYLERYHVPGVLARTGLLERVTLSPEGHDLSDLKRMVDALHLRGRQAFGVSFHSSSLVVGGSPYVRTPDDVALLKANLCSIVDYILDSCDAVGSAPLKLYDDLSPKLQQTVAR
jgi:hypothetical protein